MTEPYQTIAGFARAVSGAKPAQRARKRFWAVESGDKRQINGCSGSFPFELVITDSCLKCGLCMQLCPVSAIKVKNRAFVIRADICVNCLACLEVCPVGAVEEASSQRSLCGVL